MSLEHVQEHLNAYLDGELDGAARARVEAHLATCGACRDELEELRVLDAGLRRLPEPDPGPRFWAGFVQRVEARLPEQPATAPAAPFERLAGWLFPSGRLGWLRPAGVLLTATFLTYVGLHGYRSKLGAPPGTPPGSVPQLEAPKTSGTIDEVEKGIEPPPPAPPATTEPLASVPSPAVEGTAKPRGGETRAEPVSPVRDLARAGESVHRQSVSRSEEAAAPTESGGGEPVGGVGRPQVPPAQSFTLLRSDKDAPSQERLAEEMHIRNKTAVAPPRAAVMLEAGKEEGAALSEDEVTMFVAAAVAGDTVAARRAAGAFAARHPAAADSETRRDMQRWFAASEAKGAPGTVAEIREGIAGSRADGPGAPSDLEALLALDDLVWPRREIAPGAGESVVPPAAAIEVATGYLARQFAARAASDGRARDRARQYLEWLVAHSAGPQRSEWETLLERLP